MFRKVFKFMCNQRLIQVLICINPWFPPGVSTCRWAGRNQMIEKTGISYYLDGAHTPLSLQVKQRFFVGNTFIFGKYCTSYDGIK